MSSKTRIIVLHMKEIIYTAVFLALAVILAVIIFLCSVREKQPTILPPKNPATSQVYTLLPFP